jgi:hypothetical protein
MRRSNVILGCAIGCVLAAIVLSRAPRRDSVAAPARRVLSDCDGRVTDLVIHYIPEARETVDRTYRDFLRALGADVTVHAVCPDEAAFADLQDLVGPTTCRLKAVLTGHDMTAWSRDRWLALAGEGSRAGTTLLRPRNEAGADVWPARRGDERVAGDIAAAQGRGVWARRSGLLFDGGDFVADEKTVFVTPSVAERNIGRTVADRAELVRTLRDVLGKKVVLLDQAPPHHAGMFMMTAGRGVMLVGDPNLGRDVLGPAGLADGLMPPGEDRGEATQALFDAVARRCQSEGYRVIRMPTVVGRDGRTYLTYLNVVLDGRPGGPTVYMPAYRGAESLNAAARAVWERAGWRVSPVDCTKSYVHFGSLRCLVNVLRREEP